MSDRAFDTPLELIGPFRAPKQMLAEQEYSGHTSIHDDDTAEKLGFRAGPIEGPTHFSQFVPLLHQLWGQQWFETGCISSHYQNMVVEGEEVRAHVSVPRNGETQVAIRAEKKDGTPVLAGTASIGSDHDPTELEARMARLRPFDQLVILRDLQVGQKGAAEERVIMEYDQHLGAMYPFTLNEKLAVITEDSPWHRAEGDASPWGRPIIPLEMVCVLCSYSNRLSGWHVREPHIGLFADLEIGMLKGPLFVGQEYVLDREVVALGESRRTEGYWVKTLICDCDTKEALAYTLLHTAVMKDSFPGYAEELAKNSEPNE
jgi:hypothetical protein